MARNVFHDGEPFSTVALNSLVNAHDGRAVLSGLQVIPGAGDFESDVSSGEILVDESRVDVGADVLEHDPPGDEDRLDLITADAGGGLSITTGDEAAEPGQPNAPSIPDGEVLVAAVYVREEANEIQGGDIYDEYRTLVADVIPSLIQPQGADSGLDTDLMHGHPPDNYVSPIYGDAEDGEIVHDEDADESGILYTSRYEVEDGSTVTVDDSFLIVHAQEEIVVDGTIDASGQGAPGGTGGGSEGEDGDAGEQGDLVGELADGGGGGSGDSSGDGDDGDDGEGGSGGGAGGAGNNPDNGGSGGDAADKSLTDDEVALLHKYLSRNWEDWYTEEYVGGSGGAGGGGGALSGGGPGGDGGSGGGVVLLIAPRITGSGVVDVSGQDGDDGEDSSTSNGSGGGGGGGGAGGAMLFVGYRTGSISTDTSGGIGGDGGSGGSNGGDGGRGGDGIEGRVVEIAAAV